MASDTAPEVGDTASWSWNGSHPTGEVAEKKTEGDLAITSSRGNTIRASGSPSDPAVHLARSGNDVVKKQSDLDVEQKGDGELSGKSKEKAQKSKADGDKGLHINGANGNDEGGNKEAEVKTGEKRKATEEPAEEGEGDAAPEAKKARGRPKKDEASAPKAKPAPKAKKAESEKKKPGRKPAAEKKEPAPKEKPAKEVKAPAAAGEKKGRGRPKKDDSASTPKSPKAPKAKKALKAKAKPVAGSMGTRTRSRA